MSDGLSSCEIRVQHSSRIANYQLGDTLTINGYYELNPDTLQPLRRRLMQWRVVRIGEGGKSLDLQWIPS